MKKKKHLRQKLFQVVRKALHLHSIGHRAMRISKVTSGYCFLSSSIFFAQNTYGSEIHIITKAKKENARPT